MRTSEQISNGIGSHMWNLDIDQFRLQVGHELGGKVWFNVWNQIMTPIGYENRENN
jgi:hypothetical protein